MCEASTVSPAVFFKVLDAYFSGDQILYKWHDPIFLVMVFSRDIHPKISACATVGLSRIVHWKLS